MGTFNNTSCAGSGSSAICFAVGTNRDNGTSLLYQTTVEGDYWNSVATSSEVGTFNTTSASATSN